MFHLFAKVELKTLILNIAQLTGQGGGRGNHKGDDGEELHCCSFGCALMRNLTDKLPYIRTLGLYKLWSPKVLLVRLVTGQGDLGIFLLGISTKRLVYLERAWYLVKALSIWRKDLLYKERPWYIEELLGI